MAAPRGPKRGSLRDIDFSYYFSHYFHLFWRKKIYLLVSFPLVAIVVAYGMYDLIVSRPELSTTVVIGLSNPSNIGPVENLVNIGSDKVNLIKSRHLLSEVVDSLSLQFRLKDYSRHELFDSLIVDTTAARGKYEFKAGKKGKEVYRLLFTNKALGITNKLVQSGTLASLDSLETAGIQLFFNHQFLKDPVHFSFNVISKRLAVDHLLNNFSVDVPLRQRPLSSFTISMKGRDYPLITKTVNTIADVYIAMNLGFRKRKTNEALAVLEKQLDAARKQLDETENKLRAFRSSNPTVGLNQDMQSTITDLTELEMENIDAQSVFEDGQRLINAYANAGVEKSVSVIGEILAFLNRHAVASATILQNQFSSVLQERDRLLQNYAEGHPLLAENRKKVQDIGGEAVDDLNEFVAGLFDKVERKRDDILDISRRLYSLPSKELQLAKIKRQQQLNSDLFSSILSRYNEAKVANAVEISDIYIIDQAVEPIEPSNFFKLLQLAAIAFVLALVCSFGPVIFLDFIDKTVRTESELKRMSDFLVLESIPEIKTVSLSKVNNEKTDEYKS
jgi:capsular polysaccharide biosynthesis protein